MMLTKIFPLHNYSSSVRWICEEERKCILDQLSTASKFNLLFVPEEVGASLLLQAAMTLCSEGRYVIYVAPRPLEVLPPLVQGMPEANLSRLDHLKMMYFQTTQELVKFLSNICVTGPTPDVLLVQELQFYAEHNEKDEFCHGFAYLLALLCNVCENSVPNGDIQVLAAAVNTDDTLHPVCSRLSVPFYEASRRANDVFELTVSRNFTEKIALSFCIRNNSLQLNELYRILI